MYSDLDIDPCGRCGCCCFGNTFLCDGWQRAHPCPSCGCGKREAWLIAEEIRQNEFKARERGETLSFESESNETKEGTTMSKRTNMPEPSGSGRKRNYGGGSLPEPEGGGGSGSPYLKAEHLSTKGKTKIQILGNVRESGPDSFSDLDMDAKVNGKPYTFSVKFSSGNYRRLFEKFGKNPTKWKGVVQAQIGEYLKKKYVQLTD